MIVLDTSAIVAIFRQEPEARRFAERIEADEQPLLSAANLLECSMVVRGAKILPGEEAERWIDSFLEIGRVRVEPVTARHAAVARSAHRLFGKGSGHAAQLNYGDCFAYALAKTLDVPLLFKGNDFSETDLRTACEFL